jgi:pilus assembly protein CpaB
VKVPEGTSPAEERKMLLTVANRPADNNTTFVTGGDVSRFQRRSVPGRASDAQPAGDPKSANAQSGTAQVSGPVVRVARGNNVTVVPVGAR